jgi:dTMP kinase
LSDAGRLIAFEGIEGAGKSTQIRLAANALRARGVGVVETREPGGTAIGAQIRRIVMQPGLTPNPWTELFLYVADRAQHVSEVIRPALSRGDVVLTDRFSASTIAYQGYGRQLDIERVLALDATSRDGVWPALTVLLDCPVATGLPRARGDDRFHREEREFHERVRRGFLSLAAQEPDRYRVIDATEPADIVHQQVLEAVLNCLHPN